jgi:hypothetical protein
MYMWAEYAIQAIHLWIELCESEHECWVRLGRYLMTVFNAASIPTSRPLDLFTVDGNTNKSPRMVAHANLHDIHPHIHRLGNNLLVPHPCGVDLLPCAIGSSVENHRLWVCSSSLISHGTDIH